MEIGSSPEEDCRLHPQDWTDCDYLKMALERGQLDPMFSSMDPRVDGSKGR